MQHIFTVDVEDWYHGFPPSFGLGIVSQKRLNKGMNILLDTLDEFKVKATFFWLASHAREYPTLLKDTFDRGHEIGCHGNDHIPIYEMSPARFSSDIHSALEILSQHIGNPISCFRAPYFSLRSDTLWAVEILIEHEILFDSSILPIRHWRTGIPDAKDEIHIIETQSGSLIEVPITTTSVAGKKLPTAGGGYFRAYPYWLTDRNISESEISGKPAVFYIHPWELDKDQPRINGHSIPKFMHYLGIEATYQKLRKLLHYHEFGPLMQIASSHMPTTIKEPVVC